MSEIGNQILTRFDKVDNDPAEAFPWSWRQDKKFPDFVFDACGHKVAAIYGYGGNYSEISEGITKRRRLIATAPSMFMLLRDLRNCGVADPIRAAKILEHIEGRTT